MRNKKINNNMWKLIKMWEIIKINKIFETIKICNICGWLINRKTSLK